MNDEDQLSRTFEELDFSDEPAMTSGPDDDVRRGQRRLRRRRAVMVGAGLAAGVVMATGAVAVLPNAFRDDATLQVASGDPRGIPSEGASTVSPSPTPTVPSAKPTVERGESTAKAPGDDPFPYPATRALLLDAAVRHLDPGREHLPEQSENVQTGGYSVGSKLDWAVSGEDGLGMVKVVVTSTEAEKDEHAVDGLLQEVGCLDETDGKNLCEKQTIPGTSEQAWVGVDRRGQEAALSVLYQRTDGSYVGIGTFDLFGNNSQTPVSRVDVSLEQALAFVTDPGLKLVPGDKAGDGQPK
ncbi:hypothetical protein [Flindersiella endophytica]